MVTRRKSSGSSDTQDQVKRASPQDDVPAPAMCNMPPFLRRNVHRAIQLHQEELENRRSSTQGVRHRNHRLWSDSGLCRPDDIVSYYRDSGTFQVYVKTIQLLKKDAYLGPQASRARAGEPLLFHGKLDIQLEIRQIGSEPDSTDEQIVSITHKKATIRGTSPFAGIPAVINAPPFVVTEGDFQSPFIRLDDSYQYTLRISIQFEDSSTAEEMQKALRESGSSPRGVPVWRASYADILRCPKDSIVLPLRTNLELSNGKGNVDFGQDEDSLGLEVLMGYTGYARPGASSPLALANQRRKSPGLARHRDTAIRLQHPERITRYPGPSCRHCGAKCFDVNTLQMHLRLSHGHSGLGFPRREAVNGVSSRGTVDNNARQGTCEDEVFIMVPPTRAFNCQAYLKDGDDSWLREAVRFSSPKPPISIPRSENTTRGAIRDLGAVTSGPTSSRTTTPRSGQKRDVMLVDGVEDCPASVVSVGRVNRTEGVEVEMEDVTVAPSPEPSPCRAARSCNSPGITPCQPSAGPNHPSSRQPANTTILTLPVDQLSIAETTDIDTVTHSQTPAATGPSQRDLSPTPLQPTPVPQKQHLCAHRQHHLKVPPSSTTFFHPLTSRPLVPGEPLPCPEAYDDMDAVDQQMIAAIQHDARLNRKQKAFLSLYNPFMRRERVGGFVHLGPAMVRFAREMVDKGVFGSNDGGGDGEEGDVVWWEFRKLLGEFQGAGFIWERVVRECEGIILAAMRGRAERRRRGRMEDEARTEHEN